MTDDTDKSGRNAAGRFKAGNPGKRRGTRNKATVLAQKLLHDAAGLLTTTAINMALQGDPAALKLCMARILPPPKDAPVRIALPEISSAFDASCAATDILGSIASGELTPSEGQAALNALETFARIADAGEVDARLTALEAAAHKR